MNVLFLDDDPERQKRFRSDVPYAVFAATAADCINHLATDDWDLVLLDHDLADEMFTESDREDTGAEVARWMAEHKPEVGLTVVHSLNCHGRRFMVACLRNAGYSVLELPFGWRFGLQLVEFVEQEGGK